MSAASPLSSSVGVPLFDLSRQHAALRHELIAALAKVCDTSGFILGPECRQLEESIAAYCRVTHAVGCASGSDALLLALMAMEVGPGDEVIVPSYTFFATASAVWRLGARPVFVDIEPATFNLDAGQLDSLISSRTKAIIPVHLFGQCADMRAINEVAAPRGIAVIEDAAQAIGAEFEGRRAGSLGAIGCLSFYPTKNLGGGGDGGMLTTDDDQLAVRLRLLRGHGMEPRYYHPVVGINSRLDSLQAAILNVKLPHLDHWCGQRLANAQRYERLFAAYGLLDLVTLPGTAPGRRHVWNQYIVRVPRDHRDPLRAHLAERGIGTEIYYPLPLHQQACFASLGYKSGSLPETERAARETIALPIFPELQPLEQERVVAEIASHFGRGQSRSSVPRPRHLSRPGIESRRPTR